MPNVIRPTAASEPKSPSGVLSANPPGWAAIHTALKAAALEYRTGQRDLVALAKHGLDAAHGAGYRSTSDSTVTRFTASPIMAWQDAMFVVNELQDWRFPDELVCVAWLIECGGPGMGRGKARARFETDVRKYIGGTRRDYNAGTHGNGDGWPQSREFTAADCVWL